LRLLGLGLRLFDLGLGLFGLLARLFLFQALLFRLGLRLFRLGLSLLGVSSQPLLCALHLTGALVLGGMARMIRQGASKTVYFIPCQDHARRT
jgi:hypothetical protein